MTLSNPSTTTSQATGLPESAIGAIQEVLASHPEVEAAILYGSRALGRHRPASDIDLTLMGSGLDGAALARIDAELDDLLLPWVIDLSCHSAITHPALLGHIARAGQLLYRRPLHQPHPASSALPEPSGVPNGRPRLPQRPQR